MELVKLGRYKLQEVSRAYYIAIPRKWIESKGLVKGAWLEVAVDDNGNLLIKPVDGVFENEH